LRSLRFCSQSWAAPVACVASDVALRAALPALEWHEQDERFTTAEATRILIDADLSRARRKAVIDQQAAALILQGWLDRRRRSE